MATENWSPVFVLEAIGTDIPTEIETSAFGAVAFGVVSFGGSQMLVVSFGLIYRLQRTPNHGLRSVPHRRLYGNNTSSMQFIQTRASSRST